MSTTPINRKQQAEQSALRRAEAKQLNDQGYMLFQWSNHTNGIARTESRQGICIGYAFDSEGRDCFLIRTTNDQDGGKFVVRCVPVDHFTIRKAEDR